MPYVIVKPKQLTKGPQGAVTRQASYIDAGTGAVPVQYPTADEVAEALPNRSGGVRRFTSRAGGSQFMRTSRAKSVFEVASAAGSPLIADGVISTFELHVAPPTDGSQRGMASPNASIRGQRLDSTMGASRMRPNLHVSQFWASTSQVAGAPSRHSATAASPLAPVLFRGVDVQACLFHVGAQKKWFYEDTLAEMQQAALAIIPPEYKHAIEASFPDALKKGHGVLGAMSYVSRNKKEIAPMPNAAAKAVAGMYGDAQQGHADRRTQMKSLGAAVLSPGVEDLSSSFRASSRPPSVSTPVEWTPEAVMKQLRDNVSDEDMALVRGDTMSFRNFEAAAEDLLAHLTASKAQEFLDVALDHHAPTGPQSSSHPQHLSPGAVSQPTSSMTPNSAATRPRSAGDGDERLQAMRQELLSRRVEHLKVRERRTRRIINHGTFEAVWALFDDYVRETRHAVAKTEANVFTRIAADETAASMRLSLRQRQGRHALMDRQVAEAAKQQEEDLRAETAARIADIDRSSLEATRAVRRALAYTDSHVKSAITQEREERLRELLAYRRTNPATYFPAYSEDEVDGEFVPMRIATAEERERQERLMAREGVGKQHAAIEPPSA